MTKKILVAVALTVMALMTTSGFAQTCSSFTGANVQFMGAGSSAQFNSFAYGALYLANGGTLPNTGYNLWTGSHAILTDTRPADQPTDTGVKVWVVWDNAADCKLWVNFSVDSTVGVKDFFAYRKVTQNGVTNALAGAVFASAMGAGGGNLIPGFADSTTTLPTLILNFLQTAAGPTATTGPGSLPYPYCGQKLTTKGGTNKYCYFNAGLTDIRPEDALYATTRALSAYNTTNGLTGLGYNSTVCGGVSATEGCPIYDAVGQSSKFNVLSFKLTGTDPITLATLPLYSTLNTGIAPLVVFVNNADTTAGGFGSKSGGQYVFNNVAHKTLGLIYEGTLNCTTDIGTSVGAGKPITAFVREPLSGTYNAFEFTAVRTLSGSAATAVKESAIKTTTWFSGDQSGQELDNNPTTHFNGGAGCPGNSNTAPDGSESCGDPMLVLTPSRPGAGTSGCGQGIRARTIGTGEEVSAVRGGFTLPYPHTNSLGYAFWSYQNFKGLVSSANCTSNANGNAVCTGSTAHYLAVDGVDPFTPEPGAASLTTGAVPFELPQCWAVVNSAASFPCAQIPFTHVLDGGYPLWSLLRLVTFENVQQDTGTIGTCVSTPANPCPSQQTPQGVSDIVAAAEINATNNSFNLSDFAPFLTNVTSTTTGCPNKETTCYKGDLALGVFRSHYVQSVINPVNGHAACGGVYTGIFLNGNTYDSTTKVTSHACLIDSGGDVGGSVLTVQADQDFNNDFGSVTGAPAEIYGLHQ